MGFREEQKRKLEELIATGTLTPEEIEKLREGIEKPPQVYDSKKIDAHVNAVRLCKMLTKYCPFVETDWELNDNSYVDGNGYIFLCFPADTEFYGEAKKCMSRIEKSADSTEYGKTMDGKILVKYTFKDIVKPGKWEDYD